MNGDKVYCLMVSGPGLDDEVRNILFDTAQEMAQNNRKKQKVKGEAFEGQVTTQKKVVANGGVTGVLFRAEIDTDVMSRVITYMIRPCDLRSKDGMWVGIDFPSSSDPSLN